MDEDMVDQFGFHANEDIPKDATTTNVTVFRIFILRNRVDEEDLRFTKFDAWMKKQKDVVKAASDAAGNNITVTTFEVTKMNEDIP